MMAATPSAVSEAMVAIAAGVATFRASDRRSIPTLAGSRRLPSPFAMSRRRISSRWSLLARSAVSVVRPRLTGQHRPVETGFKLFFCGFVVLGASINLGALIDLSDAMIYVVAIPNLMGLYLLAPVLRREVLSYRERLGRY